MPTKNIKKSYDKMYEEKVESKEAAPAEEPVVEEAAAEIPEEDKKASKPPITKPFMGEVTGGLGLNVRKTPNGEVIAVAPDGAQVRVLSNDNPDWYKIESPDGYVMKKFIKKI